MAEESPAFFFKLMMFSLYIFFKSCSSGLFQSSGGFRSLIRGLFQLINRESSLDQRAAGAELEHQKKKRDGEQRLRKGQQ